MQRLYSTFAGGWPGIGLLLMRLVVGAVVLWYADPRLWSDPPLHTVVACSLLAVAGLLLIAGLWTPIGGAVVAVVAIFEILDGRTCRWAPSSSNHRRRADDARTGPVVDRRPALRMEAHRPTSAQK